MTKWSYDTAAKWSHYFSGNSLVFLNFFFAHSPPLLRVDKGKGEISTFLPLTLTLSPKGERVFGEKLNYYFFRFMGFRFIYYEFQ